MTDVQKKVMDTICSSDLVYYVVPNYCGLPCANYLAYNERCVGYFNMDRQLTQSYMSIKKAFIIVSNTENDFFVQAMRGQTNQEPEILYLKTGKYGKRSIAGDLMDSEAAAQDLAQFIMRTSS